MTPGTIILLNGVSCSGKTSLATALQDRLPEPFLHVGPDGFEAMQPARQGRRCHLFYGQRSFADPERGPDLLHVMHQCARAFSEAGAGVVMEHIFLKRRWLRDAVERLHDRPVLFVGLSCPVDVLEQRERERTNKAARIGQAARQFGILAPLVAREPHDLVVDTAALGPEACAELIVRRLEEGPAPDALRRLRGSPVLDEEDAGPTRWWWTQPQQ